MMLRVVAVWMRPRSSGGGWHHRLCSSDSTTTKPTADEWRARARFKKRRSISPVTRLVEILPDAAFQGEKESLTKIGQSPNGVDNNKESHDVDAKEKRSMPQNTFRRKRMSVEDRLQTMMSDSISNDNT